MLTAEWVTYGSGATDRLGAAIEAAQGGDPLQPVTVVTPSPGAAIVLRRRLGRHGMAAVTFLAVEQLAELIAARPLARAGRPVLVPELVTAGVRVALQGHTGELAVVAHHRATEERLAEVVLDLSLVPEAERRALPGRLSGLSGEVADVAVRALDALAGHALDADLFITATAEVSRRPEVAGPLGSVIIHLPGRIPRPHADLVRALAGVTDVTVLAGHCGIADADESSHAVLEALGCTPPLSPPAAPPTPTAVIAANDVDDEVRTVLRHLMALVDGGTPVHRVALLYSAADPYARTIADQLRAAGVPFSAPSTDTLATTVAGRTLLGALDAVARGCEREAVIDLVGQGPVLAADGALAPVSRWDTISRRAGIIAGSEQWSRRLRRHAEWREGQADDPETEPHVAQWRRAEAADAIRLGEFVAGLVDLAGVPPRSWAEVGAWAHTILLRLLGPSAGWVSAPSHEIDACTAVEEAMDRLGVLATLEPNPSPSVVRRTIQAALDIPAPRRATTGHGMIVAPVSAGPGLDVDAVAVVGLVEGLLPRPARESALLPDDARVRAGLLPSRIEVAHQHRALVAGLAGGSEHRIVSWSRGDQRSGRTRIPSRWLVDLVEPLLGDRPTSSWLAAAAEDRVARPWLWVSESFSHGLARVDAPTGLADADLAHAAGHVEAGGRLRDHPLAEVPVLAAAVELVEARRSRAFTRFDGNLAGHAVAIDDGRPLSPTSMEAWATCPRSYLFTKVLGLEDVDRPEEIDRLQAADVGKVAHKVLETIVRDAIHRGEVPAPGEPWPDEVHHRVVELVDAGLAELEARGRAGHPRYWSHDRRTVVAALQRALRHDAMVRARHGVSPVAVEMSFGDTPGDALHVALPGGRKLPFRGYIDRVDQGEAVVSVLDYKTGSDESFKNLSEEDPVKGGRKLQLGIYALAARQRYGVDRVRAEYWFTRDARAEANLVGFELGNHEEQTLLEVMGRIVSGIEGGVFPARPGPHLYHWRNYESCLYCDLDRLCSPDRAEEWDLKRDAPILDDYRTLAEGPDDSGESDADD